ncbi:hypothetical protein PCANC_24750 [Puccinia coronata f. sp. avenae]|uniref:Uncharacterized protein n=1 Tax=Puccinia coronata f. sp. avenae TaxID=200324 RepID=A0A2N5TWV0_9BASI|nr:hypothetical protein PCANC_24750 [Puccinia coronata f. sp. avenae]
MYHLSPSNTSRLGAVIPTGTYQDMLASVRTCPSFVIPISKSSRPKEPTPATLPFEMQYLMRVQCDFVKKPARNLRLSNFLKQATTGSPTIPAMIVMYTPLAEYKLRQLFSQPTLILTHYTDLADSHGLVLMRGDITPQRHPQNLHHWRSHHDSEVGVSLSLSSAEAVPRPSSTRPPQQERIKSPIASFGNPLHHPLHRHADELPVPLHVRESMYAQVLSLDNDNNNSKEAKEIMDRELAIEGRSMTSQLSSYSSCSPRNQLQ